MILLVSNSRDITTDFIVAELRRRGASFFRFNSDLATPETLQFRVSANGPEWLLDFGDRVVSAGEFIAGYFRRPELPALTAKAAPIYADQVNGEWRALLLSFYANLKCSWLSSPEAIARAEDKPRQLALAHRLGLRVPDTLVSASFRAVEHFVGTAATVAKPLKSGKLASGDDERIAFASRIETISADDREAVSLSPVIYQREVGKACDVRVTVVADRVFACELMLPDATEVDWRKRSSDVRYQAAELPGDIAAKCRELVRSLDLRFGAIDLIRDQHGEFWFLEINPNGQWAWLEHKVGLPISAAIVDVLTRQGG